MATIQNRSEILFLYDAKRCNPNGDPLDANRPRIDEETGRCLVTDVRLKRTIRDYLLENGYNGEPGSPGDIFIRDVEGKPVTGKKRSEAYANREEYLQKFIDVRLFGGVSAPKEEAKLKRKPEAEQEEGEEGVVKESPTDTRKTFHFTGPVQFGMGRSLNRVTENFIKGTGAFTTDEKNIQKTFREEYNITYGFFAFHGVVNEQAARYVHTSEEDIQWLMKGIWEGTKGLLSRSKKGHMPRMLLKIDYNGSFFIGDLAERLFLIPKEGKREETYEDVEDFIIDTSRLVTALEKYADKIKHISVQQDDRLVLSHTIPEK